MTKLGRGLGMEELVRGVIRLSFLEVMVEDDGGSERSLRRCMHTVGVMETGTGKLAAGAHLGKSHSLAHSDIIVRSLRQPYPANLDPWLLSLSVKGLLPISMAPEIGGGTILVYAATNFCFSWAYNLKWL